MIAKKASLRSFTSPISLLPQVPIVAAYSGDIYSPIPFPPPPPPPPAACSIPCVHNLAVGAYLTNPSRTRQDLSAAQERLDAPPAPPDPTRPSSAHYRHKIIKKKTHGYFERISITTTRERTRAYVRTYVRTARTTVPG